MKLSDYVIHRVAREVKHLFMLAGGGSMHLVDSVGLCRELEYVCNIHEQTCAVAADAYGQYTNSLGAALVTTGPGGTNTLTGVAAAWLDSTPCLFISGQVKRADMTGSRGVRQMGFQEINIVRIVESITKYAVTIVDPASIRYHMDKALYLARHGRRGPVWIDIPLDVQAAKIEENSLEGFDPPEQRRDGESHLLSEQVKETVRLLNRSERPVILVGNGVRSAKSIDSFLELTEALRVPVLTTWKASDFLPEDHPLYIGRPGAVGQRGANFAQQNSDWILVLGARLDPGQTGYSHYNFARAAKKIVVDIDPHEIGKLEMILDVSVCADSGEFIREFLRQRETVITRERSDWWTRCREWKARYPVVLPEYWEARDGVNNYVLADVLSEQLCGDDLLVPGSSGACSELTMQATRIKKGMRVLNSQGLGSMGFGIPASIGACLAGGRKRTVCIEGDGGFHMNMQELETVRRLNLPIKFFVLNNEGYASIRTTQDSHFQGRYVGSNRSSGLTLPDTLKVSSAYGLAVLRIEDHSHIRERVHEAMEKSGPVVCDVRITPGQFTAPRLSSRQKQDGSMVSKPMEDLWPFLDREEFRANMMIPPVDE